MRLGRRAASVLACAIGLLLAPGTVSHSRPAPASRRNPYPFNVPPGQFVMIKVTGHTTTAHPRVDGDPQSGQWKQRVLVREGWRSREDPGRLLLAFEASEQEATKVGSIVYVPTEASLQYEFQQFNPQVGGWYEWSPAAITGPISTAEGSESTVEGDEATISLRWGTAIHSLGVRIKTRDEQGAGTSNRVYFDVGPKSWQLEHPGAQFARGETDEFPNLDVSGLGLTIDDLIEARLEKKGTFVAGGTQWTGAPDLVGGAWRPERLTIIVNGEDFNLLAPVVIPADVELNAHRPAWMTLLRPLDPDEAFARGLRVYINDETGRAGEIVSGFTTIFKEHHLSGWFLGPVKESPKLEASAVGTLRHPPSAGTDGFVSLDLELERVSVGDGPWWYVNSESSIPHQRYIRVEYDHGADHRYEHWAVGEALEVRGLVRWDTDKGGFYEIHPSAHDKFGEEHGELNYAGGYVHDGSDGVTLSLAHPLNFRAATAGRAAAAAFARPAGRPQAGVAPARRSRAGAAALVGTKDSSTAAPARRNQSKRPR